MDRLEPALVSRARSGDVEAFADLYDQHRDTVLGFLVNRTRDYHLAEDLASETFVRALRRIDTFTWQGQSIGAWFVTIARHLLADHFKSSRCRLEHTTDLMVDGDEHAPDPEALALAAEDRDRVRAAVGRLPDNHRRVIVLQMWGGCTPTQIAAMHGTTPGAVKTMRDRALKRLHLSMKHEMRSTADG